MNNREIYAACIYLCLTGLSWLMAGFVGVIILNAGFWISAIDIGWVDDLFAERPKDDPEKATEPLPDNVIVLPVKKTG